MRNARSDVAAEEIHSSTLLRHVENACCVMSLRHVGYARAMSPSVPTPMN